MAEWASTEAKARPPPTGGGRGSTRAPRGNAHDEPQGSAHLGKGRGTQTDQGKRGKADGSAHGTDAGLRSDPFRLFAMVA